MSKFYNLIGDGSRNGVPVELIAPGPRKIIKSVLLANVHVAADATVTLFIQDDPESGTTRTFNMLHTVAIPADSSLFLDNPSMFLFGEEFGLYATVGSSDTVDIIVNQ